MAGMLNRRVSLCLYIQVTVLHEKEDTTQNVRYAGLIRTKQGTLSYDGEIQAFPGPTKVLQNTSCNNMFYFWLIG